MTKTKIDKRSLAAAVFVRDRPEYRGCFSPTQNDMGASFREKCVMMWNRGMIFYGKTPDVVPAAYAETTYDKSRYVLQKFQDFEDLDYRYNGDFSLDALRSTIEAQKKAARAAGRRRVQYKDFWRPYVVWAPGQRPLSFSPDVLSVCCTMLGDERMTMWLPRDEVNVQPMRLANSNGVIYILPIRT